MVFSNKLNKMIIKKYKEGYRLTYEGKEVSKLHQFFFKFLDCINNIKFVICLTIFLLSIIVIMYVDYITVNFFGNIAIEYWITFISIGVPPILIWYITIKSENKKSINNSKLELLVLIIKLRIEGQKIYEFSKIAKEDLEFEIGLEMKFHNDGEETSIKDIITSSRLTMREVMFIFMSLEFNNCSSAIMYNSKEITKVNNIQNDYVSIDNWDELISSAQKHIELTEYLEHVLRTYK